MAFERFAGNQLDKWDQRAEEVMTEQAKSVIVTSSIIGAVVFALPLWGAESFIYFFVLWSMYKQLAETLHKKFGLGAVMKGIVINVLICLVANLFVDFLFVFGWIAAAVLGYFATYQSGKSYLGLIAGKKKV